MKLFKKLAAVALAAVLALSMVGCGNANSVNPTKQLILDMMADSAAQYGGEFRNTPDMDSIAQRLLTETNAAYQDGTQQGKTVKELMQVAAKKDGVLNKDTAYTILFAEDYQFKSSFIPEADKQKALQVWLHQNSFDVNYGVKEDTLKVDVGAAAGKIGDKTYVVVVETETPADPDTTTKD